ncbi:MAG TPA: beta-propeller fold lactonase family protein [Chthoniobacteraceae bacterium]|nr:beta-propeller fold lactonase family protein [Chthoniobacteraceae bacterium]
MPLFIRFLYLALFAFASAVADAQTFLHFEARQVHPIALTPDGTRLLALNSTDGRLSVFDVSNPTNPTPVLIAEIPVGIEPVSVRARTNDEVWVVNEVSDSVSIVSLSRAVVTNTLRVSDEPADVVFANGKAYVTCARSNAIKVFDSGSQAELATIALTGLYPRALAASADGTKVYAAFLLSGNRTTALTAAQAPAQPAPTNAALPAAPDTGLIVPASDPRVPFTVLDNDVAEINTSNNTVTRYFAGAGTNLFDIAVQPGTGDLWIPNTEALNVTRFEPVLRGHFVDNRVTKILVSAASAWPYDLNAGISYAILPNPDAQEIALAQPTSAVFAPDGADLWVTAFGSDRIAKIGTDGVVKERVDVRTPPVGGGDNGSRKMRGPRGLVWNAAGTWIYVLNKLSNTVSVVDPAELEVISEVSVGGYDPMPAAIKEGRGFLFDARLSGNGTMSCASCHIDADLDGIAWDLGDPGGSMITVMGTNAAAHQTTPIAREIHPMKGPLTTQTLRGMQAGAPFHWRGDRPTLQSFNPTFDKLMAGSQIATADINAMSNYLLTLRHHPNPNRNLNNSLPTSFSGGNPIAGKTLFDDHIKSHCITCHAGAQGSNNNLDDFRLTDSRDQVKTPPIRTVYQRIFHNRTAGAQSISGYGLNRDGTIPANFLPTVHFYDLDMLETATEFADVKAYVLCFDTGTPQSSSFARTVTASNMAQSAVIADMSVLESQAGLSLNDLVVQGLAGGRQRSFFYNRTTLRYVSDKAGEAALTRNQLLALLGPNDAVTFGGTLIGQGLRRGGDRDRNGTLDGDEAKPEFTLSKPSGTQIRIAWPETAGGWMFERSASPTGPWNTVLQPLSRANGLVQFDHEVQGAQSNFYRLRRTW